MMKLRKTLCVGLTLGLLISSQATARRTVIDQGEFLPDDTLGAGCTVGGAACTATILPFSFDFGTGSTNLAYIYDRGIISFGDPIPGGADPSGAFTSFGVPVIAPLYVPGPSGVAGPYQVSSGTIEPLLFDETLPNFGTDLFRISFLDPATIDAEHFISGLTHVLIDASATEIRFEFIHGQSTAIDNQIFIALPNVTGTQLGYSLGNDQVFQSPADIVAVNAFSFTNGVAVPEPGTWMTMLLGFGLAGHALRRRRRLRSQFA